MEHAADDIDHRQDTERAPAIPRRGNRPRPFAPGALHSIGTPREAILIPTQRDRLACFHDHAEGRRIGTA